MSDPQPGLHSPTSGKSWFEKITQALSSEPKDREEFSELLEDLLRRGVLDENSFRMIQGILCVRELRVRDVMIPRSKMTALAPNQTLSEVLDVVIESGHSRFPVVDEEKQGVLGILLAKELLNLLHHQKHAESWLTRVRPAMFVPESKRLDTLLQEFRQRRNHMAMVVDEYGGVTGLITIEDLLEEIVGDIEDEFDLNEEDSYIKEVSNGHYLVKAITPLQEFNEFFRTHFAHEAVETIGGLLVRKLGHLPQKGETIGIEPLHFKIVRVDKRRIHLLQVEWKTAPSS